MSIPYNLETLIQSVRLRGGLNSNSASGSGIKDEDIQLMLNEEVDEIAIHLTESNEDYMVVREALTPVGNQDEYRINPRAFFQKIKYIYLVDTDNNNRSLIKYIDDQDQEYIIDTAGTSPMKYFFRGSNIVFTPRFTTAPEGHFEVSFYFKPSSLVYSTDARQISSVNTTNKQIVLTSAAPSSWTTSNKIDVHSQYSGSEIKQWDLNLTNINNTILTFSDTIDASIVGRFTPLAGDWVCLANQCVLPCLPVELHPALAQAAVCRVYESLGDRDNLEIHASKLNRMIELNRQGVNDRSETAKKIVPNDSIWDHCIGY